MKKYFQLYDVASDYSLSPVKGKYQFGDLTHAKTQAQKIIDKWVAGMKTRAGPLSAYKIKWSRGTSSGIRPDAKMEWSGSIHNYELVYKIIERSKNPVKKKRSAKQLANDKRLGRMAKARAKNPHRKKVAKKSALRVAQQRIQRATNPVARSQVAALSKNGKLAFHDGIEFTHVRANAASWKTSKAAERVARDCGKRCAVVSTSSPSLTIKNFLKQGKV